MSVRLESNVFDRILDRQRQVARNIDREVIESLRDGDDAGQEWNAGSLLAMGIAYTVEPFVVIGHDLTHLSLKSQR